MKRRKAKKQFWFVLNFEKRLNCKVKPLPGMRFFGRGKGTHLVSTHKQQPFRPRTEYFHR